MTLDEFRRHPAYDYYIRTLVSNCLICELDNKFDYKYKNIVYIKPNFENETKDYIIRVPRNIIEESEECRCLKGVKLEDVTPELEQKAFEEMK